VKLTAGINGLQNDIVIFIYYKRYNVNVFMDGYKEDILSLSSVIFKDGDIFFLQDQFRDKFKGETAFSNQFLVFSFIPDDVHKSNI